MGDKLAIPISDQPYYDDSPIGAIKDWHIGVDSRARGTQNISGTCTTDTADKLTYATGGFSTNVSVGDIVYNSTDSVYAFVTAVDSDTVLSLDWDAFPDGNEDFEIYTPTTPGFGWKRLDTDLTVDDPTSPYYGLTIKAQKAKITEGYDTGWVANSDWTEAEFVISHNLGLPLHDLIVDFLISTDGTEAGIIIPKDTQFDVSTAADRESGYAYEGVDFNTFNIHTGSQGIRHTSDNVASLISSQSYYYKVKVYRKQDVGIIPIIKTNAGLGVMGALSVDSLVVGGITYDSFAVGTVVMYDGNGWTDNSTMPGWYACIAANASQGCPDLVDKFIMGGATAGTTGGSNDTHTHDIGHTHDTDSKLGTISLSHNHIWARDGYTGVTLIASGNNPGVSLTARTGSGASLSIYGGAYGWAHLNMDMYTNSTLSNYNASHSHATNAQSTSDSGVSTIDNRPAYYSMIFIRKCT